MYKSVSAFAPICALSQSGPGEKARGFFEDPQEIEEWDGVNLLRKNGKGWKMLVDQGTDDGFYKGGDLKTGLLEEVGKEVGAEVEVRYREGYDHGYYFVSTFGGEHVEYHAKALKA